jgi:acyl-CoA thioesterase-1
MRISTLTTFLLVSGFSFSFLISPAKNINGFINTEKKNVKIINAFGDSLTAGYGLPLENSYPSILEKKLQASGYNYKVINSGLSGDTTAGGLSRIKWVLGSKPEIVILNLGANDSMRGLSVKEAKKNLSLIIEEIQKTKARILLCGMRSPRNMGEKYYKEFDAIYPELAKKYKLELVPFFLDKVALKQSLNIEDGIHPNEKGYKIIVEQNLWKHLLPMLKK